MKNFTISPVAAYRYSYNGTFGKKIINIVRTLYALITEMPSETDSRPQ